MKPSLLDTTYWQQIKETIQRYAAEIGIDKIGFTSADPFLELKDRLIVHREKGYESGFEEKDIDKRVYPELTLEGARSIIAIAIAYPSKMTNFPKSEPEAYRGILARSAWGLDYHHVLRDKLNQLADFIQTLEPDARLESMVDTGVLSDRAVAERAGIGWVGKNCSIITPEFGSYVYLGEMITNLPLPSDQPMEDQCGECTLCLDTCPTQALVQGGQLNSQRCVAFLTQVKNEIPEEFREKIGNRLYGCDTCQTICPKNKGMNFTHHPETLPDPELVKPLLKPLLTIGNKEFKARFGTSSAAWRGKKPIQRNAILGLAHFRDKSAIPDLIELLNKDSRPVIRGTSAWALGRIGGELAMDALELANLKEQDESVMQEIQKALKKLEDKERDNK
ncbi:MULTISPECIES: tRNA epoxyqueuosine(34) reductase QueG [Brevibacillus]|uniref:Epoxyqueuosine reductase n=1 Tax=Brevibacillus laterosporus TaxID=1465 RepID=A0AAP3DM52_BRELA|nr:MULTISPECIES: tRNA epoxyqueuosine(34) reductase QueG [Brevibacillus]MCR8983141.1 tRNA epoxyqueuosine(34) reductase QueG [Brevibacillus laterosporus]MCZ0810297.1 tRNA epoxyqueuosine(34) reductase QueG [Brevibacillus laterosporus]MCZ0828929.1 tRNA epoxyqueuosine(34) reductase QueG [Brevibacillus laterosporus]MCZ0852985.1 tRNA epoxyqueuosine(34) reductase QueG [Brevibacillus laterosporus]MED1786533.1 tRNA epoxyqueuosine(34) reductase QueG [Brevibacillus laterosporus]